MRLGSICEKNSCIFERLNFRVTAGPTSPTINFLTDGLLLCGAPATTPWHYDAVEERPFSNRVSFVNGFFLLLPRVTVLFAVGIIRRNIWSEAQVLQCPQRAGIQ